MEQHPVTHTGMQPVGECARCGRMFFTIPTNGKDNYRPAQWHLRANDFGECGGDVVPRKNK